MLAWKVHLTLSRFPVMNYFSEYPIQYFPKPVAAIVAQEIQDHRPGRVACEATTWPARLEGIAGAGIVLPVGRPVMVYARQGLCLFVSLDTDMLL